MIPADMDESTSQRDGDASGGTTGQGARVPDLFGFVVDNPGTALTLGYLMVTAVGMMSSWAFYREFGINIFDFTDVSDLAIAAVRTPFASLAVVVGLAIAAVVLLIDRWMRHRFRWYAYLYPTEWLLRLFYNPVAYAVYFVLYAWLAAAAYADWERQRIASGQHESVVIEMAGTAAGQLGDADENVLLGTTHLFVIVYHPSREELSVIPYDSIERMVLRARR